MKPAALLLQFILHFSPAEIALQPQPHDLHETVEERAERMAEIARDVWFVASIEAPFPGMNRWQSALAALAVARVESDMSLDVDTFQCTPPRADGCRAFGLLQAHPAKRGRAATSADATRCPHRRLASHAKQHDAVRW